MPSEVITGRVQIREGEDVFLTGRIVMADGTNLVQADVSSGELIALYVYDKSGAGEGRKPNTTVFSDTSIALSNIFDSLQTDGYWDGLDSTGYNFRYQLQWDSAGSDGPYMRANHKYLAQFSVLTDSFGKIRWAWEIQVLPSDAN